MIIEAKATRDPKEPVDPRKKLDFNNPEKLSRLPLYFALFITGIAAYLKSAFPALSLSYEGEPAAGGAATAKPQGTHAQAAIDPGPGIDDITTGSVDGGAPANTITSSGSPWQTDFELPDAPALAYARLLEPYSPQLAAFFPAAFSYAPHNDNADPVMPGLARPGRPAASGDPAGPAEDDAGEDPDEDDEDENPDAGDPDNGDPDEDDEDEDDDDDDTAANRAPMTAGPVRLRDVFAGQVVLIGLSEWLYGATDPDGDILTINDITVTGGILTQVGNGWSFASFAGMLGTITFSYDISDGLIEIVQTAMLQIVRKTHTLTPGDDVYVASPYDDDIDGLAGDDIIDARAGNDVVVGGEGDDHINGGDGDDQLFGGAGNDVIFGGHGHDIIGGGDGDDRLFGEEGNDIIDGDAGNDTIMGGAGDDVLDGGSGDDMVLGEAGNDAIEGGIGNDTLLGGEGDDVIAGNEGHDTIEGNAGADLIAAGSGDDTVRGGDGNDNIDGGADDDELAGDAGDDTILGGDGDDEISGGDGADVILAGLGADIIDAGPGDDLIDDGDGDDTVDAGAGDDIIKGSAGDDDIDGGDGHDVLDYSGFTTDIYVDMSQGTAWSGQSGLDLIASIEEVIAGAGDDTIMVGATGTILTGGGGNDLFIFTVTEDDASLSQALVHEILDFVVGDRIRVAEYDIAQLAERSADERFEALYDELEQGLDAELPIRVRYERYDDMDHTIIEADLDRNDVYEISINVHGLLLPTISDHTA